MKIKETKKKAKESSLAFLHTQDLSTFDLLRFKCCTKEGILYTRNNTVERYFKIYTTDLDSLNDTELAEQLDAMTTTCRTYVDDLKLVIMTSKTNTQVQQDYWREQLQKIQQKLLLDPSNKAINADKEVAIENIQRLKEVELVRPDLNFYFKIFSHERSDLLRKQRQLMRTASAYRLKPLNQSETEAVLYRCNNMNDE